MTVKEAIKELHKIRPVGGIIPQKRAEAIDMAIKALKEVEKHKEVFEWCTDCKEYDQEQHCCHRWSKCISETLTEQNKMFEWNKCIDEIPTNEEIEILRIYTNIGSDEKTYVYNIGRIDDESNEFYDTDDDYICDSDEINYWRYHEPFMEVDE